MKQSYSFFYLNKERIAPPKPPKIVAVPTLMAAGTPNTPIDWQIATKDPDLLKINKNNLIFYGYQMQHLLHLLQLLLTSY